MPPDVFLYVARHGQTSLNAQRKFRGAADPPLDPTGLKEAQQLADLFKDIPLCHIFCSDKQRSVKTAEIISKDKGLPITRSAALNALDVGEFSGKKRTHETEASLQQYLDSPDQKIPGGESLSEFQSRIRPCLEEALHLYLHCGLPVLFVGHSSVIHEVGTLAKGSHQSVLVEPGGAVAVYYNLTNQKLDAEPIYKPLKSPRSQAETIT
jgi:probable phosphoglycerate mutase